MIIIYPLILPTLLGFLTSLLFIRNTPLPYKTLFVALMSIPLGLGLTSLLLFFSYIIGGIHAKLVCTLLVSGVCLFLFTINGFLFYHQLPKELTVRFWPLFNIPKIQVNLVFILNLILLIGLLTGSVFLIRHYLDYFIGKTSWNVHGGWDAHFFWHLKPRFYFRDPTEWKLMFSPLMQWSNRDYPLMLPGAIAWGWNLLEQEAPVWPIVISGVFFLGLSLLITWFIATQKSWHTAIIAGIFFLSVPTYRFWSTALYADIAYAFFTTSAVIMFLFYLKDRNNNLALFAGLLAGLGPWTKNEGLFFVMWFTITLSCIVFFDRSKSSSEKKTFFLSYLSGIVIPIAACLYLRFFLTGTDTHLIQKQGVGEFIAAFTDWAKIQYILVSFIVFKASQDWNWIWGLFGIALVARLVFKHAHSQSSRIWIFVLVMLLVEIGYAAVLSLTPMGIEFHVKSALGRLLLHVAAMAVIFTFDTFGFQKQKSGEIKP